MYHTTHLKIRHKKSTPKGVKNASYEMSFSKGIAVVYLSCAKFGNTLR